MKKYKHKQTGKTCTEEDTFYYIDSEGNLPKWVVENSIDWEEVKEKDYEILSWRFGINFLTKTPDGTASEYHIHSIKRLLDGEVFTVGDKITSRSFSDPRKIDNIKIIKDTCWFEQSNGNTKLEWAIKVKEPLLITENGVELFEGDSYSCVFTNFSTVTGLVIGNNFKLEKNFKYFSTKEAAEKYVEDNKPRFSKKELVEFLCEYFPKYFTDGFANEFF